MVSSNVHCKVDKKTSKFVIRIQKLWRKCINFRNNTKNEIEFFRSILKNIMLRVSESYKNNILSVNDYKKTMEVINSAIENLNFFPSKLTIRFLKSYTNYSILVKLARIKIMIMDLTNSNGSINMNDMFEGTDDLSDDNKCSIHGSFSSNDNWNYDWNEYCSDD